MKIIVSHDVDHYQYSEHFLRDLIVIKHFARSYIEKFLGKISWNELYLRHLDICNNKMNNVKEILDFNRSVGIKSTFFFGMNRGLGLNYNFKDVSSLIKYVLDMEFEVGVHGIAYNDLDEMKLEYNRFKIISGLQNFGIRMHYLRHDNSTLNNISEIGYLYDSTLSDFCSAYKTNEIFEFPVHMMDCLILNGSKGYQELNLEESKKSAIALLERAESMNINYFSFLFHDCYFSKIFSTWKDWYIWFINYLLSKNYEFVTYSEAVKNFKTSK